ncbi:MAG: formate dehydrogenase accessory sulfurtransferase FdhD [Acidimicrobiales bacterium]
MPVRPGATTKTSIWAVESSGFQSGFDAVATEEPLEIRVLRGRERHSVAVTMRTPGADFELAAGFLFSEGVVKSREHVRRISYCLDDDVDVEQKFNIVNVRVSAGHLVDFTPLERHFSVTSACGVCGKATLEALHMRGLAPIEAGLGEGGQRIAPEVLGSLPSKLQEAQSLFRVTGGVHASGLFTASGELVAVREDVGRHNAMDKLVGWAMLESRVPLAGHVVMVSGRSSFELVQKALAAGVPILCSVSAPSSLAVDLAREFGLTLVGFLRDGRFKIYSGIERIETDRETRA